MPYSKRNRKARPREDEARGRREISPASEQVEATRLAAKHQLFELHDKARDLFEQGKYRESFDTYVEYGDLMGKTKGLAGAEATVLEAARKFEALRLWFETGSLYLIAANFLSSVGLILDASDFYIASAETLEKAQDKNLSGLIASCYGAASQTLRIAKKFAESDKTLMRGVLATTGKNPLEVESGAFKLNRAGNFLGASELFTEAATIYLKAIDDLSDLALSVQQGPLVVDVKSTLHHRAAQNYTAAAASLLRSDGRFDAIEQKMDRAADQFTKAVINFTPLFTLGEAHKVDYRRYSYDLMMGTALRMALGSTEYIEMLEDQLSAIDKKRTKELEESGYLNVALALMRTRKVKNVITDLTDINLGSIDELKDSVMEMLLKPEMDRKKK